MNNFKSVAFSAMQPSGSFTLGNYLGSLKYWSDMQKKYQCFYCIADLHALTTLNINSNLEKNTLDAVALYLACGINPKKSIIFVQSHVLEHTSLYWFLNCHSSYNELKRMTQFKVKQKSNISFSTAGLLNYPILMAADILLYQSKKVIVGEDQKQHLELTRNLAKKINSFKKDTFVIPETIVPKYSSKIMSLLNPYQKMSKSDINVNSTIFLLDKKESIIKKIKKAVTDSDKDGKICYDLKKKPGISNFLKILSSIREIPIFVLENEFSRKNYSDLKQVLIDEVSTVIEKIKNDFYFFRKNELFLKKIVNEGAERARFFAKKTMNKIFNLFALLKNN
ncbi:tryptophan--tRNA ligase [Buchnera aphidicola (Mindarus keteleerifoliae)]|uniref:tryptophan--tRNA ligase n=1 Tax=Buchnera aphidicola TaxID=9 RepID=UPI0031B6787C